MEFQIHPIGPMLVAGLIYFPLDQFSALVERHQQLRDRFLTNSQHGFFSDWRLLFLLSPKTGWGGDGFYNDWRSQYFSELHPGALEVLTTSVSQLESPWTDIKIANLDGAVSRMPETATAYGNRGFEILSGGPGSLGAQGRIGRPDRMGERIAGQAGYIRDQGSYANFLAADEPHRVSAAHGQENYRRLQELKSKYDPENFFRANPNVPPAQRKPADAA